MSFDPNAFMNSVINDANSTSIPPTPEGDYVGTIADLKMTNGIIKRGAREGQPWYSLNFNLIVEDPRALVNLGPGARSKKVRANVMLDLTPQGTLDVSEGANISLGILREATGLNDKGKPFSPAMLEGRSVKFSTKQRVDENDPSRIYDDVYGFKRP